MLQILNTLLNAGIVDGLSEHEKFRLKSLNIFCLACTFIPFVYIAMLWNTEFYELNYLFLIYQSFFFLTVIFNLLHKYTYSKILLVLTTSISVVVVSSITGYDSGFHLYLYCTPLYVFLLFNLKEIKFIFGSIFIYIVAYILIFVDKFYFLPLYHFDSIFIVDILYPINLVLNFFLLLFLFYNYTKFYFIMEKELLDKNKKLIVENINRKDSELKIKKLYKDLKISYENLEQFNFIVSHNLRAPLTNILGLNKLIENDNLNDNNSKIFNGIDESANKINEVLSDLNYILNLKTQKIEDKSLINFNGILNEVLERIRLNNNDVIFDIKTNFEIAKKYLIAEDYIFENYLKNYYE